jgi:hypothetical protein
MIMKLKALGTRINGVIKEDVLGLNVSILGYVNLEEK